MRKSTMRRLPPVSREIAKLANEAASVARRLRNLAWKLNDKELTTRYPEPRGKGKEI